MLIDWEGDPAEAVERYRAARRAPASSAAYAADWRGWERWLQHLERPWQAATDEHLAQYLGLRADAGVAPSSLTRAAAGIEATYRERGGTLRGPLTAQVLMGIHSSRSGEQRRARPLLAEQLRLVIDAVPSHNARCWRDWRDVALLLVAWQGALRRAECVGLEWADVVGDLYDCTLRLRSTKGRRLFAGAVEVPLIRASAPAYCPIGALAALRARSQDSRDGPVFRRSRRGPRLGPASVGAILRRRLEAAGIDTRRYSAHSLRAGLITQAALAGVSVWRLAEHTRHRHTATLDLYVRGAQWLEQHPARDLL